MAAIKKMKQTGINEAVFLIRLLNLFKYQRIINVDSTSVISGVDSGETFSRLCAWFLSRS